MSGRRRPVLSLFESSRRPSLLVVRQQGLGLAFEALVLGGAVVAGSLERRYAEPPAPDAHAWFLAPVQKFAPAPSQERIAFVGLAGPSPTAGELLVPADHGTRQLAVGHEGERMPDEATPSTESDSPQYMSEIEVDSAAALDSMAVGPEYPPDLMKAGVQGVVYAQFVVDSTGAADTTSLVVLEQVDARFVQSVRAALPRMKYRAAVFAGKRVAQLVQQAFVFRIQRDGTGVTVH